MSAPAPLRARLLSRAAADLALLRELTARASTVLATATAATAAAALLALPACAEVPAAPPAQALFDENALIPKASASLFAKAASAIDKSHGLHVRFAFVRSLPYGETPDEYARELADAWALGDADVLFVASPKLARAGVYVGAKAAPTLTREIADSLANETYAVQAGVERYGQALLDVSNRLIPVLGGEQDPGPPDMSAKETVQTYKTKSETSKERSKYVTVVVVILVISVVAPLLQTYWYVRDD